MHQEKGYKRLFGLVRRRFGTTRTLPENQSIQRNIVKTRLTVPKPEYDINYFCNPSNRDVILNNIKKRKNLGDIDKVLALSQMPEFNNGLLLELKKLPNRTHPDVLEYGEKPYVLKKHGYIPTFDFKPKEFSELAKTLRLLRSDNLGPLTGQRGYILLGELAELEEALTRYVIAKLIKTGFKLVSVPDIIPRKIIERCGLIVDEGRTLVYNLGSYYGDDFSLAGTAEMSLAAGIMNTVIPHEKMPLKIAAVSRCYRAEASSLLEERGLYRVHQFTKVEMFICSTQDDSEIQFQKLLDIQEDIFSSLGLHFQVLDMPAHELGAPAYRKVDIEGWMPGRKQYGELSSCSNCTDYQSRRLSIKHETEDSKIMYVHTLNGTACAMPRMMIALCESYQNESGNIRVPSNLIPYMNNGTMVIEKQPVANMRKYKYSKIHT